MKRSSKEVPGKPEEDGVLTAKRKKCCKEGGDGYPSWQMISQEIKGLRVDHEI